MAIVTTASCGGAALSLIGMTERSLSAADEEGGMHDQAW